MQAKAFNGIDLSAVIIKLQQLNDYTMLPLPLAASIVSLTETELNEWINLNYEFCASLTLSYHLVRTHIRIL